MTPDKLKTIIAQKEGTEIEFKESKDNLARKVYESICAFLNRKGGHVVLGAKDNGEIVGVNPAKVQEQMNQLAKDINNPQLFKPTYYLTYKPMDIDGKKIIYFYVPESNQSHSYNGIYESTPKSPYVKNAFHFVTFTNVSAINTAVGIDILLNICTDFKQSESTA